MTTVAEFKQEYAEFVNRGGIGSAELYALGRRAGEIADERRGPHRILAYLLRTILFSLAERANGAAIGVVNEAGLFFRATDGPFAAAIAALERPTTAEQAIQLADRLLDATHGLLR